MPVVRHPPASGIAAGLAAAALAATPAAAALHTGEVHGVITSAGTTSGLPDPHGLGVGSPLTVQYAFDTDAAIFLPEFGYSVVNASDLHVFSGAYEFALSDEYDGFPFQQFFYDTGGVPDDIRYITNFSLAFNDERVLGIFLRSAPTFTDQDPHLFLASGPPLSNFTCHRDSPADPYECLTDGGGGWTFDDTFEYGSGFYGNTYPGFGSGRLDFTGQGVPEPATWALMILGFGGLGALLRRKRRILRAT